MTSPTAVPDNKWESQDSNPGLAESTTLVPQTLTLPPFFHVLSPILMTMTASHLVINFLLLTKAVVSEISIAPSGIFNKNLRNFQGVSVHCACVIAWGKSLLKSRNAYSLFDTPGGGEKGARQKQGCSFVFEDTVTRFFDYSRETHSLPLPHMVWKEGAQSGAKLLYKQTRGNQTTVHWQLMRKGIFRVLQDLGKRGDERTFLVEK